MNEPVGMQRVEGPGQQEGGQKHREFGCMCEGPTYHTHNPSRLPMSSKQGRWLVRHKDLSFEALIHKAYLDPPT